MTWPLAKSPLETCIIPYFLIRRELRKVERQEEDRIWRQKNSLAQDCGLLASNVIAEILPPPFPSIVYTAVYQAVYEEMMK
jgi:hypothetical protein